MMKNKPALTTSNVLVGQFLKRVAKRIPGDTPLLDAQVLLAHLLGKTRTWIAAHPEFEIEQLLQPEIDAAFQRLERGEPLPYLLGLWEFCGMEFIVTPDVLIPRPETETIVERATEWLKNHPRRRTALDIGTGSGCIPIALCRHIPDLHMQALDISAAALAVAQKNAEKHGLSDRIQFLQKDLLPTSGQTFDLITANLPYIPSETLQALEVYRHEPALALDGGHDGLDLIRRLVTAAPNLLTVGGMLLLEIEARQGNAVLALAYDAFTNARITLRKDIAGHDRIIEIKKLS